LSVGLLGPLTVKIDGREVPISGTRRRDVLIRLVLNEGRRLESGGLLESVWEGEAPTGRPTACRPMSATCAASWGRADW
jgi:hypothetical protein